MTRLNQKFTLVVCNDLSDEIEPGVLQHAPECNTLRFCCPCGCGRKANLNLYQDPPPNVPKWQFDEKTLTVTPSVNDLKCGAHYFIRNGEVVWC